MTVSEHIRQLFTERWSGHDLGILRCTLLLLLQGRKVSPELLAETFDESLTRVTAAFDTNRYDLDDAGEVVDVFGVTLGGSRPFTVTSDATTLHICCALVAIMACQLSADTKTILSTDPVSGRSIKITASETEFDISPRDSVAVLVAPSVEEFCADPWNTFCKHLRFYESADAAGLAASKIPSAITLSVGNLVKIASLLSADLWAGA